MDAGTIVLIMIMIGGVGAIIGLLSYAKRDWKYLSKKYNVPKGDRKWNKKIIDGTSINPKVKRCWIYIWKENDKLIFVSSSMKKDFGKVSLNVNDIQFFKKTGDFIGEHSDSKIDVRTSSRDDNMQVLLCVKENGREKFLYFESLAYDAFLRLIPSKEFSIANR